MGAHQMFNHIIVPLDGSALAECVLPHLGAIAQVGSPRITVLRVLDPTLQASSASGGVDPFDWQLRKAEAELYLQTTSAKMVESGIEVDYALREGRTPENILDFAHGTNSDLVVLTTHGASGLSRWNTSSVVSKVLEKIYLPVLLVRAYQEMGDVIPISGDSSGVTATEPVRQTGIPPIQYRRILLPIDSSRRAECALPSALTLAREQEGEAATVILGAVINPPDLPVPTPYPEEIRQLIDRFMQLSRAAVEMHLNEMAQRLQAKYEIRVMENENISAALHELADQENVDLVVLCAHGQTGGTNWPYGTVARNYLDHGTKSVLVIQDVPLSQAHQTAAELAAERYGRR
jgi:nucleotide-binding universal stress UspA family protein